MLPLVSATGRGIAPVLPGSSIKGALRSQSERIVRTLLNRPSSREENPRQRFLTQLDQVRLIEELFGARNRSTREVPNSGPAAENETALEQTDDDRPLLGLGALSVADCYARDPMKPQDWHAIELAKDEAAAREPEKSYDRRELWQATERVNTDTRQFHPEHHVAIDRWTGGAADGMLYSVLAPMVLSWETMRLTLDFKRLPEESRLPALMLLLLTLRDLAERRIPMGFAVNRGMGEIAVGDIHLHGYDLDEIGLGALSGAQIQGSHFSSLNSDVRAALETAWKEWETTSRPQASAGGGGK